MIRHRVAARRTRAVASASLALLTGTLACWSVPEVDRREIKPWLICSDCTNGELARVVAKGPRALRYLQAALADGPTAADDSVLMRQSTEGVMRSRRYRAERNVAALVTSADSAATVSQQLEDFRLRYRLRAAEALYQIDPGADSAAVKSLCANAPPELANHQEYRARFQKFGPCP